MSMTSVSCGAVILAGGLSRRMGRCKAMLPVEGQTMLLRTREQLSDFDAILLSCNDAELSRGFRAVPDLFHGVGPLSGIHAALSATEKEALFTVPCDLPNFSRELPQLLLSLMDEETDVLFCQDGEGNTHPLCGIYRRRVLPVLEDFLREDQRRVMNFIHRVRWRCVNTGGLIPDRVYFNMNTPEDYQTVLSEGHTPS